MPYFDLARVEYLRSLGLLGDGNERRQFAMRAMKVEYHAPARFDDSIEIDVRVSRIGTTSVTTEFAAYLESEVLAVTAEQTAVLVDLEKRTTCPVPDSFRERIRAFEGDDLDG
jgi:acyl-CoA thioester hydrolase